MTTQIRDLFASLPMGKAPRLPHGHPAILHLEEIYAGPRNLGQWARSTACYRQYVGEWELRGSHLYLAHLSGLRRLLNDEPILADWVSQWVTLEVAMPGSRSVPVQVSAMLIRRGELMERREWTSDTTDESARWAQYTSFVGSLHDA